MLAVWYLMSIIGFGVHTCIGSQRSYVTAFASEVTCGDIHPEHHCADSRHCHDEAEGNDCGHRHRTGGVSLDSRTCCSDDFVVLTLTGVIPSSENDYGDHQCSPCPFNSGLLSDFRSYSEKSEFHKIMLLPDSGLTMPEDVQSVLGIWRI